MKKIIASILTGVLLIPSLSVSASTYFTDVKQGDWYYETVTEMAEKGLFEGKGDNMFCPNDTMTVAEFITVVVRALYPDEDITAKAGEKWWQGAYDVAVFKRLLHYSEIVEVDISYLSGSNDQTIILDIPIQRQVMAMISVRALKVLGETDIESYESDLIPDYSHVGTYYRDYVCKAYGAGIIVGDENGNFNPRSTLTRAEASTVLYRLVNPSKRVDITDKESISEDLNAPITIYEGQHRTNRLAREGDTVIKADGTSVVLKKGPNGVLGEGQGVAPDLGFYYDNTNTGSPYSDTVRDGMMFIGGFLESWDNSIGSNVAGDTYYVHPLTGEGHWAKEWSLIYRDSYKQMLESGIEGKYEGEVSADKQLIWLSGDWLPLYRNGEFLK